MSKHALIIGVNGFVGVHLTRELQAHGYAVSGAAIEPETEIESLERYYVSDVSKYDQVKKVVAQTQPDCIFNLAAISSVGTSWKIPKLTFEVNSLGTLNLLEAVRELGLQDKSRLLIVGSSEEYTPSEEPLTEANELDATNPYGVSKANQERIASLYASQFGLQVVRTRSFNHTGPGQLDTFVLPSFCKQAAAIKAGRQEPRIVVGNVDVRRDFSDVRDVVRAYRMLLEDDRCVGEVYNVGSGQARLLRKLAELIASFAGSDVGIEVESRRFRPSDNPVIQADISKIAKQLGWRPERKLDDTLYEMFEVFCRSREAQFW